MFHCMVMQLPIRRSSVDMCDVNMIAYRLFQLPAEVFPER